MFGSAARSSEGSSYRPQPVLRPAPPSRPQGLLAEVVALSTRTAGTPTVTGGHRPVELNLLGSFRLVIAGQLTDVGRSGERILAAVAMGAGRQATRTQIAHALWPDTSSERAHGNLRTALYRLTRRAPEAVHVTATYLQLTVGMGIDLDHSTRLANRILGGQGGTDGALLEAAMQANLRDDLLPDWDEEWLADHQSRYRQLRIAALEALSADLGSAGHHGAAVQAALAAVQADTLRDSAHESLIRACLAQGNRHEAYAHYTTYRRVLREELGLDPSAAVGRLLTSA